MRRKQLFMYAAALCLCIGITGCKSNGDEQTNTDNNITVKASEAPTEEAKESTSEWKVVNNITFEHKANKIAFHSIDYGITVGYSGEIHYSGDQGKTWPQAENKTACLFGIDIIDENVAFACGNNKNVTKTTDGGKTWKRVTDFGGTSSNQCQMLSFVDENTGFIASQSQLAYTNDSGNTWTERKAPAKIMAIYLATATKGYLVGADRKLYVTEDAGTTWGAQEFNIEGFENSLTASTSCAFSIEEDGSGIFFYLEKGGILKCFEAEDGSADWTKTAELNVMVDDDNPIFLYLSKDAKCLTLQGIDCNAAAVVSCVK